MYTESYKGLEFTHLKVHSHYSKFEGLSKIPDLVDEARKNGMYAMALTDRCNMFGIFEFLRYVEKINDKRDDMEPEFKPIVGMDAICEGHSLTLLAKNLQGYRSLCKLSPLAYSDDDSDSQGFDRATLAKYSEGLIVCSGGIDGELAQFVLKGDIAGAESTALWFKELFGDDYYIELTRHPTDHPDNYIYCSQMKAEPELVALARRLDIKLVATNNVHFVTKEQAEAHEVLVSMGNGKDCNGTDKVFTKQEWLKSPCEMSRVFHDLSWVAENTMEIAAKVENYTYDIFYETRWPSQPIPESLSATVKTEMEYLKYLVMEGAGKRYGENLGDEQFDRINQELGTIAARGCEGYFLLLWDIVRAAREELDVRVGTGRGSASGSIVAYCLGITDIDPLRYGLLFERFMSPSVLPDIDIDVDVEGREKVINWIIERYGKDCVAHIIATGTMSARYSLNVTQRECNIPHYLIEHPNLLIPDRRFPDNIKDENGKTPKLTVKNCIKYLPKGREMMKSDNDNAKRLYSIAGELEGSMCGTGLHTTGIVVSPQDISDIMPVCMINDTNTGHEVLATQYDGQSVGIVGLPRLDFLELGPLSDIRECLRRIKENTGNEIDIDNLPLDDEETYKLFSDGNTMGVFGFESNGMQDFLCELKPDTFEELATLYALYRPGAMEFIQDYIDRKHGRKKIPYLEPGIERCLKSTYGLTVYHEQIMQLSQQMAGFSKVQSDMLRKALCRKQTDLINEFETMFMEGGQANGYDEETLTGIWEDWKIAAPHTFNKSHAVCYAKMAYQTAYLKTHFPAEYKAALLSRLDQDETRKLQIINEFWPNEISFVKTSTERVERDESGYINVPTDKDKVAAVAKNIVAKIKDLDDYDLNPGMLLVLVQSHQLVREVKLEAARQMGEDWIKMPTYTPRDFSAKILRENYRRYNESHFDQEEENKQSLAAGEEVDWEEQMGYPLYDEFKIVDKDDKTDYNYFCTYVVAENGLVDMASQMMTEDFTDLNYMYLYVIDQSGRIYGLDTDYSSRDVFLGTALYEIELKYRGEWELHQEMLNRKD